MSLILLRDLAATPNNRVRNSEIAKGAEKEEADLLDMAPLSALYVRHIINHSARPLLCFHLLVAMSLHVRGR